MSGGTFALGRSTNPADPDYYPAGNTSEVPEHAATVSAFALDKFEVTVGRFRKWVDQYSGVAPAAGAGANPNIVGSGWQSAWDPEVPATHGALRQLLNCANQFGNWTETAGPNETYPMNCVTAYEAMAFCIWDGGRLPSEAEWEYAASGGEDRLFPWGSAPPTAQLANFDASARSPHVEVGSTPAGNGRWGHADLAGSMLEWLLDGYDGQWFSGPGASCVNCANVALNASRSYRGGSFNFVAPSLRAAARGGTSADSRYSFIGFRCARNP